MISLLVRLDYLWRNSETANFATIFYWERRVNYKIDDDADLETSETIILCTNLT